MLFKHSFSIFLNKYNLIFKSIIYFAVIVLIMTSLTLAFISPMFKRVRDEVKETHFIETLREAGKEFITGDEAYEETIEKLTIDWRKVLNSFEDTKLVTAIIVTAVFLLITYFLMFLSYFALSDIINEFMLDGAKYGFLSNMIYNLGKSALFALLFLAITIPVNFVIFAAAYLILWGVTKLAGVIFALPLTVLFLIVVFAIQNTLLSAWLPAMTRDGLSVTKALRESFKNVKPIFGETLGLFVMINFLGLIWVSVCTFTTFGVGFIIAIPSIVIFKRCAEHVLYYNAKKYKYYVDKDKVVQGGF
ncbi:MAG: hypothetical protein IJS93_01250 [Clostridia bacterium]|nr:hypothetical protein [Clostridia bacterium]